MLRLLILILFITLPANADIWVGGGFNIKIPGKDNNEKNNRNISIQLEGEGENPYFVAFDHMDKYEVYRQMIDSHYVVAAGKRLIDYEYLFFDFGIAVTSQKSIVNSSYYMFYERAGVRYGDFRITVGHWSNAGLKPPNEGETVYTIEYKVDL